MISSIATIFSVERSNLESCYKYSRQSRSTLRKTEAVNTCRQEVLLGPVVFPQADQYVGGGEVLVPGRVEDAVSCSEDPLITDQTGTTQQLLWAAFIQHHLPADKNRSSTDQQDQTFVQKTCS